MLRLEDIKIDEEFRNFLPKREDLTLLRGKIELEGWSDEPITVWEHHNTLLDGHRRYEIWKERGDDGPPIRMMNFKTREAAYHWIANNQDARRNWTDEERRYVLGRKYTAEKGVQGGTGANQHTKSKQKGKNDLSASVKIVNPTAAKIAEESGISSYNTVKRAEKYAKAVDVLDARGVVSKAEILSGAVKVPASKVIEAAKAPTVDEAKAVLTSSKPKQKEKPKTNGTHKPKAHKENILDDSMRACETIEHAVAELEKMKLDKLKTKDAATLHDGIFSLRTRITRIISSLKEHSNGQDDSKKAES